jgi:diguanylate cyclase (GGDEF)-like protein
MTEHDNEPDTDDLIRLSVFSSIGKSIVAENSIRGVLDRVMEHVGSFFGPSNWSVLLVDGEKDELVFAVVVGRAADHLSGMRVAIGEGIAGWVARYGKPAIVESTADDARFSEHIDGLTGFKTHSVVAVPLLAGGKVFGVIELLNRLDGKSFSAFAIEKSYYLGEARRLSEHDTLTGALNRRGLDKVIEHEAARLKRYTGSLSIVAADVDDFKVINDHYGHQAGDEVLKSVAEVLGSAIRAADSLARYGGDEFVVVMPLTGPEEAEIARTRLQDELDREGRAFKTPYSVTLGVHSSNNADFGELFRESDRDLYRRKSGPLAIGENLLQALDDEERTRHDAAEGS